MKYFLLCAQQIFNLHIFLYNVALPKTWWMPKYWCSNSQIGGGKKGSVWRWENLMLEPWEEHKNFFLKSKSIVETIKRHLKWPLEMLWLKMWWLLRLPMSVKAFHMKCSNVMIVKFWNFHIQTLTKQTVQIAYMGPLCRGKKKTTKCSGYDTRTLLVGWCVYVRYV